MDEPASTTLKDRAPRSGAMLGRLIVPALLLGALFAGCLGATNPDGTLAPASAPAALNLTRPEVAVPKLLPAIELGVMGGGSEPNVAVSPNGTVLVSTPISLWRSTDQGKSYKPVGKAGCALGASSVCAVPGENDGNGLKGPGDGAMMGLADGSFVWAGLADSKAGSVPVQFTSNAGDSWGEAFDVAAKNSSDREWISVNKSGTVFVQWRDFGNGKDPGSGIFVRGTRDQGKSWLPAVKAAEDGHQGPLAISPVDDTMYLAHIQDLKLKVATSKDGGVTWHDHDVAPTPTDTYQFPIAAVDNAGTVYVVFASSGLDPTGQYSVDRLANTPSIYLVVGTDHGHNWTKPVAISKPGVPAVFPWIVAGDAGRVAVVWYEGTLPAPLAAYNEWHAVLAMSTTADLAKPVFKSAPLTSEPNHVGQICVVGSGCLSPAQDRSLLDFFEVRLLPDGSPVVAFVKDNDVKGLTVKVMVTRMTDGTKLLEG